MGNDWHKICWGVVRASLKLRISDSNSVRNSGFRVGCTEMSERRPSVHPSVCLSVPLCLGCVVLDGIRELTHGSLSGVNVEKWTSCRVEPLLVSRTFLWAVLGIWGSPGLGFIVSPTTEMQKINFPQFTMNRS